MTSIYSKCLLEDTFSASGQASVVVPAGVVWVVVDVSNVTTTPPAQNVVWANGHPFAAPYMAAPAANYGGSGHWSGRQVLNAGQTLLVQSFGATSIRVSGYELTAP